LFLFRFQNQEIITILFDLQYPNNKTTTMIATLSSFATQFDTTLIKKGKTLFEKDSIESLTNNELLWQAVVVDTKKYKATVRVDKSKVTDVFCTCSPGVCAHIVAVMFALQEKLDIKSETFTPELLLPEPYILLGNRINNMVWISRAADSKNGELEKLGASLSMKDTNVLKLRARVRTDYAGYDGHPIFVGAKKLLGAAILQYQKENYTAMFNIADAILTEICTINVMSNNAYECGNGAIELLKELLVSPAVPPTLKKSVSTWVAAAMKNELYVEFYYPLYDMVKATK
jgi:hypothetical protein